MKLAVRLGVVLAGAGAFLFAIALTASADVVDPASPYQPASTKLMSAKPSPGTTEGMVPAKPLEQEFAAGEGDVRGEAVATPAPEQVVTRAPTRVVRPQRAPVRSEPALQGATDAARAGIVDVAAFLGRATSAGHEGGGSLTGGPVIVLAILGMVAALIRRRVLRTGWATDEEMPEFLYAREVVCPG